MGGKPSGFPRVELLGVAIAASILLASPVRGDAPSPLGPPFQVAAPAGYDDLEDPAVASDASGGFVVAWAAEYDVAILGRRYDSSGAALGSSFEIAIRQGYDDLRRPDVAMKGDGDFVVVWESYTDDPDLEGIFGRRYDEVGTALGAPFQIAAPPEGTYEENDKPGVASDAAGGFVVVWERSSDQLDRVIFARRYDGAGAPLGAEFQVNEGVGYLTYGNPGPAVAMDADGDFVVVWDQEAYEPDPEGIVARRFDSAGAALGAEFLVASEDESGYVDEPEVATDADGAFVVVWDQFDYTPGGIQGIAARLYDTGGAALGEAFLVAGDPESEYLRQPDVSMDSEGAFVVVWEQDDFAPDGFRGVAGRRYDAAGLPDGAAFVVAEEGYDQGYLFSPREPAAAAHASGFVVAWESYSYGPEREGIFARRFAAPEPGATALGITAMVALSLLVAGGRAGAGSS